MRNNVAERLSTLRVADCMRRDVVNVRASQTMAEAADTFLAHGISGAPVVDEAGQCVGMLSAHDFVRREQTLRREEGVGASQGRRHVLAQERPGQPLRIEEARDDLVRCQMSPAVQEVAAGATLLTAARIMCAMHVHRLPVLDVGGVPVGMLTSLDVVSALVNAMEESR